MPEPSGFQLLAFPRMPADVMAARARDFLGLMSSRRSVRDFSPEPVPRDLIESAIRVAATAPSGANCQPWHFTAVSDPALKRRIREAAERVEKETYERRMPDEWRAEIAPLGTTWRKPYLETAPWLVIVFSESYRVEPDGSRRKNYYVQESVGIACGLFIAALHHMGLVTLTHTPSPMGFLNGILGRPVNERPFVLFPVGFPAPETLVPCIGRKPPNQVMTFY